MILEYFFESYMHQDWRKDYASSFDAVAAFDVEEKSEIKKEFVGALLLLLEDGELPNDMINKFGGNFQPDSEGMTTDAWVKKVIDSIHVER